jgi:SRSO17 transposase
MQLPIVEPAPVVLKYSDEFRSYFKDCRQFNHFRNYLTGLMVLENKSMANIARCLLESADKTNISRFFSESPWLGKKVNEQRVARMIEAVKEYRRRGDIAGLIIDDTLCEHVGSLFEYVTRHYHHAEERYPLSHNLVTSHYVCGKIRFPVDLLVYRRYEEQTRWEEFVKKHFPEREIPKTKKARQQFHKEVDPILLGDEAFKAEHDQFKTKITLATMLLEQAVEHGLAFEVVLFDGWYLAKEFIAAIERIEKDWISILKKNRNLEVNSFVLKDKDGQVISLPGPHIKVADLIPLIPANAFRPVEVEGKKYWCFSRNVAIPTLGKVRLVISFDNPQLQGDCVVLVTNRLDWSAEFIIQTYLHRWPIETFYQDSKGQLGLDEYRMRTAEAFQKHWSLVFVAYSFLHLHCLELSHAKGSALPLKSIGEVCRQQGQALVQSLILMVHDLLDAGESVDNVFRLLFAKQAVSL